MYGFGSFFFVMASYFVLVPIREDAGISLGKPLRPHLLLRWALPAEGCSPTPSPHQASSDHPCCSPHPRHDHAAQAVHRVTRGCCHLLPAGLRLPCSPKRATGDLDQAALHTLLCLPSRWACRLLHARGAKNTEATCRSTAVTHPVSPGLLAGFYILYYVSSFHTTTGLPLPATSLSTATHVSTAPTLRRLHAPLPTNNPAPVLGEGVVRYRPKPRSPGGGGSSQAWRAPPDLLPRAPRHPTPRSSSPGGADTQRPCATAERHAGQPACATANRAGGVLDPRPAAATGAEKGWPVDPLQPAAAVSGRASAGEVGSVSDARRHLQQHGRPLSSTRIEPGGWKP